LPLKNTWRFWKSILWSITNWFSNISFKKYYKKI